jgi:pyrroline-5-carboxylate reductase
MKQQEGKIGFIGSGNMGEAMVGALIRSGLYNPDRIIVTDVSRQRLDIMKDKYGVSIGSDNRALFSECRVLVLAVKPQQMQTVLNDIAQGPGYGVSAGKLVISIAAGIRIAKIEDILYPKLEEAARNLLPIVRVMPNTPALVLSAMSGMTANRYARPEDAETARAILQAMGKVVEFQNEDALDAVTALSGSGPAYVFYLIEAMIQGGVDAGLDVNDAVTLTVATVEGAAKLISVMNESAESLRRKVTSPGGTTEAAIRVMEESQVRRHIAAAVVAACRRSKELSQ